ncbi:Fur family transcriptional regulator [Carboxylicivirga caseinilyticus]|uniref:Fur family transcriptional regulator n=1 Tax=Carboxylicivirga caseinilyticus TaxID=3417572 RepID=UPI003D3375C3|nr:transcriptional repressor [Marinilabiliaceae bacterium A049]
MNIDQIREKIASKGLKITPQRVAILEAIYNLNNHPTAENIADYIKISQPNIAIGTIYKVLEILVKNKIIKKVTTEADKMRYDGITEHHHHLYCIECDLIEDYFDEELNQILEQYFAKKKINGFHFKNFVVQINGTFDKC